MKKPIAYISGPISNIPNSYRDEFEAVETYLVKNGFEVQNPAKFTSEIAEEHRRIAKAQNREFDICDPQFYRACMDKCFEVIPTCDLIVLTQSYGVVASSGVDAELNFASNYAIPAFKYDMNIEKKLEKWLENKGKIKGVD